jgi:hypothetical protein
VLSGGFGRPQGAADGAGSARQTRSKAFSSGEYDGRTRGVARFMGQIEELVPAWSMAAVVDALQAMRGISLLAAVTLVAEGAH